MKPLSLEPVFVFFGLAGCLVLLLGCLIVALYLLADRWPRTRMAAADMPDDDLLGREGLRPHRLAQLLIVLLGGSLLVLACFWWAGLALVQLRSPAARLDGNAHSPELWSVNLFPWE